MASEIEGDQEAAIRGNFGLEPVGGSFELPTYVTSDPGDAGRIFVVERKGKVELIENGVTTEFADISSAVSCCVGERGLMSIALAPDFGASGWLLLAYTGTEEPGEIHVGELVASGGTAMAATLRNLIAIQHPVKSNHNGGQIQFGPDGDLYVSTGDGGGGNDELHNAQSATSLLGKILRIDPTPEGVLPYTVPPGNPFPDATPPADTIWSLGLRNPFRFSFDRTSGAMVIGDVGQGLREEVDLAPSPGPGLVGGACANYGWNCREGLIAGPGDDLPPGECATTPFVDPVFDYTHTPDPDLGGPGRCAIIGGYVARDPGLGALYGRYLYADLCSGAIRALQLPNRAGEAASGDCSTGLQVQHPVSFGEDAAGRLYVVGETGSVYRLAGLPPASCPAQAPRPEGARRRAVSRTSASGPCGGESSAAGGRL